MIGRERSNRLGGCGRGDADVDRQAPHLVLVPPEQPKVGFVEQRCETQRSADVARRFEDGDVVPSQGRNASDFESGGPAADNHDLLRRLGRRGLDGAEFGLTGEHRVHCALHPTVEEGLGDADVTVDAGPNLLDPVLADLASCFGVGEHLPPHRNDVGLAVTDHLIAGARPNPPDGDHRDRQRLGEAATQRRVLRLLVEDHAVGERLARGHVPVGGQVDGVGAGFDRESGGDLALVEGDAVGCSVFECIEAHPDREISTGARFRFGDDLAQEPGPVLDRTAVLVVAPVPLARQEPGEEIAVGAVNLDGVKPGRLGAYDCVAQLLGDRCDLVGGHGVELRLHVGATRRGRHGHQFVDRQVVDHVERAVPLRQRRHIDRIAVGDIDPTDLAVVHQLHGDLRAMTMDGVGELAQRRDVTVVRHRQLMNRVGAMRVGKGRDLGDEESGTASGSGFVVGDDLVVGHAVVTDDFDTHWRHGDAVGHRHRTDLHGREEMLGHRQGP